MLFLLRLWRYENRMRRFYGIDNVQLVTTRTSAVSLCERTWDLEESGLGQFCRYLCSVFKQGRRCRFTPVLRLQLPGSGWLMLGVTVPLRVIYFVQDQVIVGWEIRQRPQTIDSDQFSSCLPPTLSHKNVALWFVYAWEHDIGSAHILQPCLLTPLFDATLAGETNIRLNSVHYS